MINTLYVDLDGVVYDTVATICALYNADFQYYDSFQQIDPNQVMSWDFDELRLTNREYINHYFGQPRFFNQLIYVSLSLYYLHKLISDNYKIIFVSKGGLPNIRLKEQWINNYFPTCKLIGVPLHHSKGEIDMSDGILIDDEYRNLNVCNAIHKICFGDTYEWNKDWNGIRCKNWLDTYKKIKEVCSENQV